MILTAVLKDKEVVPVDDYETWGRFMTSPERFVQKTRIPAILLDGCGDLSPIEVSTVFLGLNHSWSTGKDLWFETMVFGGPLGGESKRYETYSEAMAGHQVMVERVLEARKN